MKKTVAILLSAAVVFCTGSVVAYYNTSSFGYDNANLVTVGENSIQILDFTVTYDEMKENYEKIKEYLPDKKITI